jgi:hypothetical protein
VEHLWPSSQYVISVQGVTVESGKAAVLTVDTLASVPNIGSQLKLVQNMITTTTLEVIIPAADPFLTINR